MRFGIQFSLRGNGSLRCLDARAFAARQPFVPTLSHRYPKVSEFVAESTPIFTGILVTYSAPRNSSPCSPVFPCWHKVNIFICSVMLCAIIWSTETWSKWLRETNWRPFSIVESYFPGTKLSFRSQTDFRKAQLLGTDDKKEYTFLARYSQ